LTHGSTPGIKSSLHLAILLSHDKIILIYYVEKILMTRAKGKVKIDFALDVRKGM
jgi:hypothetical protein